MNSAYHDVVVDLEDFLRKEGFSVDEIGAYSAVMSISNFSVHSSIDKNYPSSINMYILTPRSNRYEVGMLEEAIDPARNESDRAKLSEDFERLKLDGSRLNSEDMQDSLHAYLKICLTKLVDFLIAHKDVIFDDDEPYRPAYLDKSRERRSRLGL